MSEKRIYGRAVQKHDVEKNWIKATNFIPMAGEIIVYDRDDNVADASLKGTYSYERIKIGDGVQNVNDLPFETNRSLKVTVSRDDNDNNVVDKTYQEIYDAVQAGTYVYMITGNTLYVDFNSIWPNTILWLSYCSDYSVIFSHQDGSSEYEVEIDSDGKVSLYYSSSLPSQYSYGYEGMVLTVGEDGFVNPADFPDTIARTTDVEEVKALVGDKSVSEQINTAVANNQSDWSVNDEDSPAYVKNRTHWVESEYIKFIDNETIPFILASEGLYASDSINNDVVFIDGNTYTFTIDGTSYDCVAHIVANYGYTYIGNVSYLDPSFEDTQEPFCVLCYNNAEVSTMLLESSGIQIATTFEGDSHAISLSGLVETYHKIDRKYLPHLVGRSGSEEGAEIFNNYNLNIASGGYAHAEGSNTTAEGWYSHTEGNSTSAVGTNAHAEGSGSYAEGINSHAEGSGTTASGYTSHAEGYNVVAASEYQHAQGKFNIEDANDIYAHIVGNGTNRSSRSNAHTISWDGIGWFANSVKIGGTGQDDEAAKELATQDYVDAAISAIPTPDVSGQIEAHDISETAHNDIRAAINDVSALVGDESVADQIDTAINNVAVTWDKVTNKPFNTSDINITWDGDTAGKTYVSNSGDLYYKVSDDIIRACDFADGNASLMVTDAALNTPITEPIPLNNVTEEDGILVIGSYNIISVPRNNMILSINYNTVTFQKAGTYFRYIPDAFYISSLKITNTVGKIASSKLPQGVASKAEFDKHLRNSTWVQIYNSGSTKKNVNAFSGIDISGYTKLRVAIKCVNVAASAGTTAGAVIFTGEDGMDYSFSSLFGNLITNTSGTAGAMAEFTIVDGFIICDNALRSTSAPNMLSTDGGQGAWGLTNVGGGLIACDVPVYDMKIATTNLSTTHYYGTGSKVIVWGCKA